MVVEVEDWDGGHSIKEGNFSSFDAVPLCIKIVSYGTPCKNLWANRTFLKVVGTSLEDFRAQVPILCQLRSGGSPGRGLALAWLARVLLPCGRVASASYMSCTEFHLSYTALPSNARLFLCVYGHLSGPFPICGHFPECISDF